MAKKTAYLGMLIALAFVFSYIESLLPIHFGVPGIKLGLANLVVIDLQSCRRNIKFADHDSGKEVQSVFSHRGQCSRRSVS